MKTRMGALALVVVFFAAAYWLAFDAGEQSADGASAHSPVQNDVATSIGLSAEGVQRDAANGESSTRIAGDERNTAGGFGSLTQENEPSPGAGAVDKPRLFPGRSEQSLKGPGGSINSQSADLLLSAGNFADFASRLARSSENPATALENEQD